MNSLYKTFEQDEKLEKEGIVVTYDEVRFRLARAGGSNVKFQQALATKLKPYRHQLDNDTISPKTVDKIIREVYADTIIIGCEMLVDGKWVSGVPARDGSKQEVTRENLIKLFDDLPEMFKDLQTMAGKSANFKKHLEDEDAKN